ASVLDDSQLGTERSQGFLHLTAMRGRFPRFHDFCNFVALYEQESKAKAFKLRLKYLRIPMFDASAICMAFKILRNHRRSASEVGKVCILREGRHLINSTLKLGDLVFEFNSNEVITKQKTFLVTQDINTFESERDLCVHIVAV